MTSCPPTYIAFPSDMREPVSSLYTMTALDSKKKKAKMKIQYLGFFRRDVDWIV